MSQRKRPPARRTPPSRPAQSRSRPAPRNAAPKPFLTPGGTPFRRAVERRSAIVAVFLMKQPKALPGLLLLGLVAAGLLAPPVWGAAGLLLVALFLTWLVYLSWPAIRLPAKAIRVLVIAMVVGYALARLAGS